MKTCAKIKDAGCQPAKKPAANSRQSSMTCHEGEQSERNEKTESQNTKTSPSASRKLHSCPHCSKLQPRKYLAEHIRTHTGEKTFPCSVCSKQFSYLGSRNRHLLSHTGEKPFSCTLCSTSFTQSNSLKQHVVLHHGVQNNKCLICNTTSA